MASHFTKKRTVKKVMLRGTNKFAGMNYQTASKPSKIQLPRR